MPKLKGQGRSTKCWPRHISEQYRNKPLSIFNVKLHVLIEGNRFDLLKKIPFEEEVIRDEDNRDKNI